MALDQAYFDAIHIDLVKKKYYNANKVEAVLEDIRRQASLLNRENELLGRRLYTLSGQKDEISEALLSAKTIAQQIISDAQDQAEKILAEAKCRSREMTAEAERESREMTAEAEALRQQLPRRLDELERHLREEMLGFTADLCGELRSFSALPEEEEEPEVEPLPDDLGERVDAIARQIRAIEDEE